MYIYSNDFNFTHLKFIFFTFPSLLFLQFVYMSLYFSYVFIEMLSSDLIISRDTLEFARIYFKHGRMLMFY